MKKVLALLLAIAMVLSMAACAKPTETASVPAETTEQTEASETVEETAAAAYPLEITDHAGRTVVIEKEPERIVSGYYISTSTVIALGLSDRLVGIEAKAAKRAIYKLSAPELIELPNVGTAKEFDLEGCIALNPDLVILPLKLKSAAESMEALGIPVLLVNPENEALLLGMVDMIAAAANVPDKAAELHSFIEAQEQVLAGITGEAPSVYLAGNSALLSTAGGNMYQSDMITMAGGANAAAELTDSSWAEISYEQLLAWDPAVIVLAADAEYTVEDVLSDPNLADCQAVRNGQVFHLPNDIESWDSPLPGSILGALWVASVLHPDEITPDYVEETVNAFYAQFYGFTFIAG